MNKRAKYITQSATIAAMYIVLTLFAGAFNLAGGAVQIRISEALTVLPYFTPCAIWGLFLGCLSSNLLLGGVIWDIVFGSLATLLGAVITYLMRNSSKYLAPIGPIISNTIVIPLVLAYAYDIEETVLYLVLTVGLGEFLSCGVLGIVLLNSLNKHKNLFK